MCDYAPVKALCSTSQHSCDNTLVTSYLNWVLADVWMACVISDDAWKWFSSSSNSCSEVQWHFPSHEILLPTMLSTIGDATQTWVCDEEWLELRSSFWSPEYSNNWLIRGGRRPEMGHAAAQTKVFIRCEFWQCPMWGRATGNAEAHSLLMEVVPVTGYTFDVLLCPQEEDDNDGFTSSAPPLWLNSPATLTLYSF